MSWRRHASALLVTAVAVALTLAASGGLARAAFKTNLYTYDDASDCTRPVDPINVVFYGRDATWGRTAAFVTRYLGWGNGGGSDQDFKSGRRCRKQDIQRASGGNASSRFHVRLSQLVGRDRKGRLATVGDGHHEDLNAVTNCFPAGHAVDKGRADDPTPNGSGFDQGRREIAGKFRRRGREVTYQNWGTRVASSRCDGDYAGSDGLTALITIPRRRR